MMAAILSGGEGTRLMPLTNSCPKPMLPLLNQPFIQYPLSLLRRYGVKEVILCTGYRAEDFRTLLPWTRRMGMNLKFSRESRPLGTAGALADAKLKSAPLWVMNGDALTDINLNRMARLHRRRRSKITLALVSVKNPAQYGLVETGPDGRVQRFLEKPKRMAGVTANTVNAGIYLFEPEVLKMIPRGRKVSLEREIFPEVLARGWPFYGYLHPGYWLDIGTAETYLQAHGDLLRRQKKTRCVGAKSLIERGSQLKGFVSIGAHCRVARGARLSNCVILEGTEVAGGTRIAHSIVGRRCLIGQGASLVHRIIADGSVVR